jgi:serine/threonine protein kinase
MHRDVKPENVLLDSEGHARLTDFGLSTLNVTKADVGAVSLCGSPGYIAPEVLSGRGYGFAADWWQLGMVLLEMTTGMLPWGGPSVADIAIAFRNIRLQTPTFLSHDASNFLHDILNMYPSMRLGSMGPDEVKRHAFFNGINWGKILRKGFSPIFNPSSSQYRPSRPLSCCGHTAQAAQKHAQGYPPRYRLEVSHDEDGGLRMASMHISPFLCPDFWEVPC